MPKVLKIILSVLMALFTVVPHICPAEKLETGPVLRALLVSCDHFPARPSTAPAAQNNVTLLKEALSHDERGYEAVRTECDTLCTAEALSDAVKRAYAGAKDGDISLFYISTHGVYDSAMHLGNCALALSDGETEELVSAEQLKAILDTVPGTKVLILDACNAGAMIGKGLGRLHTDEIPFRGPDYKVLCSAGGSEESWYWHNADEGAPDTRRGAGYFTTVLSDIFCFEGYSPADSDRDEQVTLREAYQYLCDNYCASSPQAYPEFDDDFVFLRYRKRSSAMRSEKIISDLVSDDTLIGSGNQLCFAYTQWEEGQVYYQLVYYRGGRWDWDNAQMMLDRSEGGTQPGRKERVLTLDHKGEDDYGYIMLLIITKPENYAVLQCSRLIGVEKAGGGDRPRVFTLPGYDLTEGGEAAFFIRHLYPCAISAAVFNDEGKIIRRIRSMSPSRPQPYQGSIVYWDGLDRDGNVSPPGEYRVEATLYTSEGSEVALSGWFRLNLMSEDITGENDE